MEKKKKEEVSKYKKKALWRNICQPAHTLVSCSFQEELKMLSLILNIPKKKKKE